ncbi:NarK/NasA family nitrate transporter [Alicyclobacillus curvatus]|nr:NarK/NasA family nitrate transporter [Alicyclobacillus curvatus]
MSSANSIDSEVRTLGSKFAAKGSTVMYVSMGTMIVAFVVWSMISPIAPQLQKQFSLTEFQKSVLVATPVLLGSLFRIPIGMLTDRFGGRRVYTLLMLVLLVPLFGITTAHSFAVFVFWEVLLGIAGTSFAVGIGHVSAWFPPQKQGLVLGITALGNVGTAVAGFTIPSLYLHLGFSGMAYTLMVPVVLSALVLWILTRDASKAASVHLRVVGPTSVKEPAPEPKDDHNNQPFWSSSRLWLLSFYYFITFGGFVAFGNYLPTLLQGQLHLTPVDAGLRAAGFVLLATALRPVGGYLADRISPASLLLVAFAVIGLCSLAWAYGIKSMSVTTLCALLIASVLGIGNGSVFKMVPVNFPKSTGKATGIVGAIGGIGGFFPPLIMGAFRQHTGSFTGGFLLLTMVAVVAFVVILMTDVERKGADGPPRHRRVSALD